MMLASVCYVFVFIAASGTRAYRHLKYFEELNYDITADQSSPIAFAAYNRSFILRPINDPDGSSVFSKNHLYTINDKRMGPIDTSFLFTGMVQGDPKSSVTGSVIDGIFDGHIGLGNGESFFVEKSARHFDSAPFHSIMYTAIDGDIVYPKVRQTRQTDDTHKWYGCGLTEEVGKWMKGIQTSTDRHPATPDLEVNKHSRRQSPNSHPSYHPDPITNTYNVRTCNMHIQTDQLLYREIFNKEGRKNAKRTQDEIISIVNAHVKAVNKIYEATSFDGITGINFVVDRLTVYDETSCPNAKEFEGNPFCPENVDVSNYLVLNSQHNQSEYCLAYALTYRTFEGGTIGLAWVASPKSYVGGGICDIYSQVGSYKRSLNTGIITLSNYDTRLPSRVSHLTMAHEIGHNFGAPHDSTSDCTPGGSKGNYIMFASATPGNLANNNKFSSCSIKNMTEVVKAVLSTFPTQQATEVLVHKRNCFTEKKRSVCGNLLVEEGEECDCGFDEAECARRGDKCCLPKFNDKKLPGCRLRPSTQCSPTQGPCCSENCVFHTGNTTMCQAESECSEVGHCDGRRAECPKSKWKLDGTVCADGTATCSYGRCNGSLCEKIGQLPCFVTGADRKAQCQLACLSPDGVCRSTSVINELKYFFKSGNQGVLLRVGSPCDNYLGYCDNFHKCRKIDENGPLGRLFKIFSKENAESVKDWITHHWWVLLLISMAIVVLLALLLKFCAIHTPSTNPYKAPAHSLKETLRHPTTLFRPAQSKLRPMEMATISGQFPDPKYVRQASSIGSIVPPVEYSYDMYNPYMGLQMGTPYHPHPSYMPTETAIFGPNNAGYYRDERRLRRRN